MTQYKVEICGVNTSKLPLIENEEKESLISKNDYSLNIDLKNEDNDQIILITINIMRFYDRDTEIEILRENEKQAERNAVFLVLADTLERIGVASGRNTEATSFHIRH